MRPWRRLRTNNGERETFHLSLSSSHLSDRDSIPTEPPLLFHALEVKILSLRASDLNACRRWRMLYLLYFLPQIYLSFAFNFPCCNQLLYLGSILIYFNLLSMFLRSLKFNFQNKWPTMHHVLEPSELYWTMNFNILESEWTEM